MTIPKTFIRRDLFNMFDAIAIKEGEPIIGLQVFTTQWNQHLKHICSNPLFDVWLSTGALVVFHGWRKVKKKRGGVQMIWKPRVESITIEQSISSL